ncbi:MAG: DUF2141 domain-containing protein [Chitinophagales bacterium]
MNLRKYIILLIFNSLSVFSQKNSQQLKVEITNIQNSRGVILVAIYDSEETFLDEPLQYKIVAIDSTTKFPTSIETFFEGLKVGQYAVSVYHDENENWELDRNWIGIPKEMFGFSNNARAKFSPPTFEECSVDIIQSEFSKALEIRLRNW